MSMIQRKTIRIPGWDCITGECPHTPKGDHGRHGEEIQHAVISETPDGRAIAVALVIYTSKFPSTVRQIILDENMWPGGSRAAGLFVHVQRKRIGNIDDCPFVGRYCAAECIGSLVSDEIWNRHKTDNQEATEALWIELEAKLAQAIADVWDKEP